MGLCGLEGEGNSRYGPVRHKTLPWIIKNTAIDASEKFPLGTSSPSRGMLGWEPDQSASSFPDLILAREGNGKMAII
jgi:hypothetical protein